MVSSFFVNKLLATLITGQGVPAVIKLPWIPDEVRKVESLLPSFEQHEEALPHWIRHHVDASAQCHKYARSFSPLVWRLFEASGRIKSELHRHCLLGCFESSLGWPHMDCAGHVTSHASYMSICECAASAGCVGFSDHLHPVLVLRRRKSYHRLAAVLLT